MKTLKQQKEGIIAETFINVGLNQSRAAKLLDISRGSLRTHLQDYVGDDLEGKKLNQKVLLKYLNTRG